MSRLSRALVAALTLSLAPVPALAEPAPIHFGSEDFDARQTAAIAAIDAVEAMERTFGTDTLRPGQFRWNGEARNATRVVVNLNEQLIFAFDGERMIGVSTISSGKEGHPTPPGIFPIMEKRRHHRSNRYNDAPMPFMQRLDNYGIALHAGAIPGYPASHGCIRLPREFAAKLFAATEVGTEVLVGAYQA